jgi:hypothetical protein
MGATNVRLSNPPTWFSGVSEGKNVAENSTYAMPATVSVRVYSPGAFEGVVAVASRVLAELNALR